MTTDSGTTVKFEGLGKTNFDTWKIHMMAQLTIKKLLKYVDGRSERPKENAADPAVVKSVEKWDKNDEIAKATILLMIKQSEVQTTQGCTTSASLWKKLHEIYQSKRPARKATLLKRMILHKMAKGESAQDHVRGFFEAERKLSDMGVKIDLDITTILLLYSLPQLFENFRCAIESRDDLPKPEILKIKIIEEADACGIEKPKEVVPDAMFAKKPWKCNTRGKKNEEEKSNSSEKTTFKFKCHNCGKVGHKTADCWSKNKKETASAATNVDYDAFTCQPENESAFKDEVKSKIWCLDSRASSHMSLDESIFSKIQDVKNQKINLASNAQTEIGGKGTAKILVDNLSLDLKETLLVRDLQTNLMSANKITDKGYEVTFKKNIAEVKDTKGKIKIKAKKQNGLYYVIDQNESAATAKEGKPEVKLRDEPKNETITKIGRTKIQEWYEKFGHLNEASLKLLQQSEKVNGIDFEKSAKLQTCEACIKGKHARTKFPISTTRSKKLLEIVHTDVCCPMRTTSMSGAKYFVTFIDDKLRCVRHIF
uniref:CCHC-type domain-containing protein n=1 Tax=Strigamia maritima TaxID=126957 RepID=T1IKQ2_STRMM